MSTNLQANNVWKNSIWETLKYVKNFEFSILLRWCRPWSHKFFISVFKFLVLYCSPAKYNWCVIRMNLFCFEIVFSVYSSTKLETKFTSGPHSYTKRITVDIYGHSMFVSQIIFLTIWFSSYLHITFDLCWFAICEPSGCGPFNLWIQQQWWFYCQHFLLSLALDICWEAKPTL